MAGAVQTLDISPVGRVEGDLDVHVVVGVLGDQRIVKLQQVDMIHGEALQALVHVARDGAGNVGTVDKYYNPQPDYNGSDLNVAFQMDGDYRQDPYSVWLDDISLSYW